MIKVLADNNLNITASQDSAMYDVFANNSKFIIKGIGNELRVNSDSLSLQLTVNSGECIVCGRHVTITEPTTLTLNQNGKFWIALRIDLTQSIQHEGSLIAVASEAQLKNENLNNFGNYNDLLLGVATTNNFGVTNFEDKRKVGNDGHVAQGGAYGQCLARDDSKPSKTTWIDVYTKAQTDNILRCKQKVVTVQPSDWVGKTYTFNDSLITSDSLIFFNPPVATPSNEQMILALENANIKGGEQGNGYAKIVCYGEVPRIATNITVVFGGTINSL